MYLHLGGDCTVARQEILGIFDLENTSLSRDTKAFLAAGEKNGEVVYATRELPKSFIVTRRGSRRRIYISPVSVQTLRRRQSLSEIQEHPLYF